MGVGPTGSEGQVKRDFSEEVTGELRPGGGGGGTVVHTVAGNRGNSPCEGRGGSGLGCIRVAAVELLVSERQAGCRAGGEDGGSSPGVGWLYSVMEAPSGCFVERGL